MARTKKSEEAVKKIIGEQYKTNEGYNTIIIDCVSMTNCIILVSDGNILSNIRYKALKSGSVKNPYHKSVYGIGYIGIGKYRANMNRKATIEYEKWKSMLNRCYSKKSLALYQTYQQCSVTPQWHNFQVFAEWFDNNYKEGFDLDKDILFKGNKIYSPETCCFVPREINNLFIKSNKTRGKYPIGVGFDKKLKKYFSQISKKSGHSHIGYYDTPEEAFYAYKEVKEIHIKQVADKWKPYIEERVYNAMYNYQVEITD